MRSISSDGDLAAAEARKAAHRTRKRGLLVDPLFPRAVGARWAHNSLAGTLTLSAMQSDAAAPNRYIWYVSSHPAMMSATERFRPNRSKRLTDEEISVGEELERIFMPLAHRKREKVRQEGSRFVHYTSAENAFKILTSRRIWMRNARCMNDYMEASFGHQQLVRLFQNQELKEAFIEALAPYGDDMGNKVLAHFDQWWKNIQFNTYITSISEHHQSEDVHGRLSMWRAYGGNSAKAALVLRMPLMPGQVAGLRLLFSPVEYLEFAELECEFRHAIQSIRENAITLSSIKPDLIFNMAFFMLVLAALCLKHKGFSEEREWRLIYLPDALPSDKLERNVEIVGGVPQTIYKIPLENDADKQIQGASILDIIDRVIIGPSVYPMPIFAAFSSVLRDAGIQEPKLAVSDIPLRT